MFRLVRDVKSEAVCERRVLFAHGPGASEPESLVRPEHALEALDGAPCRTNERKLPTRGIGRLTRTLQAIALAMADDQVDCVNKPTEMARTSTSRLSAPRPPLGSGRCRDATHNVVTFIEDQTHRFYAYEGRRLA